MKEYKKSKGMPQNLTSFRDMDPEKQRSIASKGGKASVEARRRAKTLKEAAKALGEEIIVNSNGDQATRNYVIVMQQFNAAMQGNLKAAQFIAKLLGEFSDTDQAANMVNQTIELHID